MKTKKILFLLGIIVAAMGFVSCENSRSYAELLNDERQSCNAFLCNFRIAEVPVDSNFEVGKDAPFYKLDPDGNVYMQVLKAGDTKNNKARTSQTIYFRYTRYNLNEWYNNDKSWSPADGNADDMSMAAASFQFNDFTRQNSAEWGVGIQMPLNYLGIDCEVNIVIKSQYGRSDEISYVIPFMYQVRYFPSKV
ncbi:MAG: DUF4827 family protein [Bacteroidales bacterium]|nr:DUF4827 family protein [Bacteroidales bacterium]